jgi:pyruvate/oxaloacetate carboxyltransferase
MGILKVNLEDELLRKFKEEAVKRFGYTKGVLSIATREALKKWLEFDVEKKKKIEEFSKAVKEAAGIWTGEEGYKFVKKIRKESEKRLKRMGL